MPSAVKINREGINPNSLTDYHIVFDLDECLIHTITSGSESTYEEIMNKRIDLRSRLYQFELVDIGSKKGQGVSSNYWGVTRPHLDKFLDFCHGYFRSISIWSAAQPSYVRAVVSRIFQGRNPPLIIFTSDHIAPDDRHGYHKPLANLVAQFPGFMSLQKTFFLDDRASNFISCPGNGLIIPKYEPLPSVESIERDDNCFHLLAEFLLQLSKMEVSDIRTIDKSQIFSSKYLLS